MSSYRDISTKSKTTIGRIVVGGSARDYFWVKIRDHKIAIKLNLDRNSYLRTDSGQTEMSELHSSMHAPIADCNNFPKMVKKTPRKQIWNSQPFIAAY